MRLGSHLLAFSLLVTAAWAADGGVDVEVFEMNCASCHGVDGRAKTPQGRKLKARDLRESRMTDPELRQRIREGSRTATGVWLMPSFGDKLKPDEIEAAMRHAKTFRPADKPVP